MSESQEIDVPTEKLLILIFLTNLCAFSTLGKRFHISDLFSLFLWHQDKVKPTNLDISIDISPGEEEYVWTNIPKRMPANRQNCYSM